MAAEHLLAASAPPAAHQPLDSSIAIREGRQSCGKATLLSDIAGLIKPASGTISIGGATDARERLARCALMPQKDLLLPWRTALDNACLALENRGVKRAEARRRARPLFERFGLAEFEESVPAQLSGGMRQRVAFLPPRPPPPPRGRAGRSAPGSRPSRPPCRVARS